MKEILIRGFSGLLYVSLLIGCLQNEHALIILFFIFGLICLAEFKKLIQLKSNIPYAIFVIIYFIFVYWKLVLNTNFGLEEATQILMVITIFVELFLIKDLFSEKPYLCFLQKGSS